MTWPSLQTRGRFGGVAFVLLLCSPQSVPADAAERPHALEEGRKLIKEGKYAEAEALARKRLPEAEAIYGAESVEAAEVLDVLVESLWRGGKASEPEARALGERAVAIKEKALGPEHFDVASSLNNLANLLRDAGDYAGARPLHERALAIREKVLGPEHPNVARSLNRLANLLEETGDYVGARPLHERALAIREKALGPEHDEVAMSLNNLANLLSYTGDYTGARPLYERALAIREKALGPEHPDVASSLNNLADLLKNTGDYAGARPLHERALAIREKALGPEHPYVAYALQGLADLLQVTGDYAGARPLYERALAIREKALGSGHPLVAESLRALSIFLSASGRPVAALDAALRAEDISRAHLRLTARTLAERQALAYASVRASGLSLALALADQGVDVASRSKVWDTLIRSRALVLDEMAARHRTVGEAGDPEVARLAQALFSASQQLANLTVRGPGDNPEIYRKLLDEVQARRERAEQALAERSAAFRHERAKERLGLSDVASALPPHTALVAFTRFERSSPKPSAAPVGSENKTEPIASYLAFVLRSRSAAPTVVTLGTAEEIDVLVRRWREEAGEGVLFGGPPQRAETSYRTAGEALRKRVWDPLLPYLRNVEQAFVVLDGSLSLVSLTALPAGESRYLLETGPLIHYLSAERDLVPSEAPKAEGKGLLALGGPAFDEPSLFAALAPKDNSTTPAATTAASVGPPVAVAPATVAAFRGQPSGCGEFQSLRFDSLPATAEEVQAVASLWAQTGKPAGRSGGVVRLEGAGASETAFKKDAPGRRVLHLATHGFFLTERCSSALAPAQPGSEGHGQRPRVTGDNPLVLSGLALAGANRRSAAGPEENDGILTAEEIASLDLSGVEWAVLSACDTGVGEVRAGEGVFGLRRAFQVAGVGTLIMSLWSVEDESARRWMEALYQGRLGKRLSTAEATREASLKLLRERRQKGDSTHPFFWAGFVAAGDWQ